MDNIAHSLFSIVVCNALVSQKVSARQLWVLWGVSVLTANIPDIDILLRLFGRETYLFYHRGLTHSFFGLLLLGPILYFFAKFIFQKIGLKMDKQKIAGLILCQLVVSHFFLDYLTAYGTMLFYPFSLERFAYPLMFIVDPLFWLVGGIFFILSIKLSGSSTQVHKLASAGLVAFVLLWVVEAGFKFHAEAMYRNHKPDAAQSTLISYPAPFAPLAWGIVEKNPVPEKYAQGRVSFFSGFLTPTVSIYKIPTEYKVNHFCSENPEPAALNAFLKYQAWAGDLACRPYTYKTQQGCQCASLKYGILELNFVYFGSYFIGSAGSTFMMSRHK